jgi:hypothetical protein
MFIAAIFCSYRVYLLTCITIEYQVYFVCNVARGKVNILVGHSIGHSKQKNVYMYMCLILKGF